MAQKPKKQKFECIADVAQAIGLNYPALKLLRHLADTKQYKLALDYDFIMGRVAAADKAYEDALRGIDGDNPQWGMYLQMAREAERETLMAGV